MLQDEAVDKTPELVDRAPALAAEASKEEDVTQVIMHGNNARAGRQGTSAGYNQRGRRHHGNNAWKLHSVYEITVHLPKKSIELLYKGTINIFWYSTSG